MASSVCFVFYDDLTGNCCIYDTAKWNKAGQCEAKSKCSFCVGDLETCVNFALEEHYRFRREVLSLGVNLKFVYQVEIGAVLLVSFDFQAHNRSAAGRQNKILEGDL